MRTVNLERTKEALRGLFIVCIMTTTLAGICIGFAKLFGY